MARLLAEIHELASKYDEESIKKLRDNISTTGVLLVNEQGDTILHLLAYYGNNKALDILRKDLGVLRFEEVSKTNDREETAVHEAVRFNRDNVVPLLLTGMTPNEQRALLTMRNNDGETPLHLAAKYADNTDMFDYLKKLCMCMDTRAHNGGTVLHAAVIGENYRVAYYIARNHPELARTRDEMGMTPLNILATKGSSFLSCTRYTMKKLGKTTSFVPIQLVEILTYSCIRQKYKFRPDHNDIVETLGWDLSTFFLSLPWVKIINGVKQKNTLACFLGKKLIEEQDQWDHLQIYEIKCNDDGKPNLSMEISPRKKNRMPNPLIQAIKHGINELAIDILKTHPLAALSLDEKGRNLLHLTVEYKNELLYSFIKDNTIDQVHKKWMKEDVDNDGNTILHIATSRAYIHEGNLDVYPLGNLEDINLEVYPLGNIHRLTWDIYWFKYITNDSLPYVTSVKNKDGKTARELFEEHHKELRDKAEKDIKDMIEALIVVAALIGTVNYTAFFTPPGGYNQTNGLPVLQDQNNDSVKELFWFGFYIGVALFSSVFAFGALISIQLSRFSYEEFYLALPLKFLVAHVSMFLATLFSMITCLQASILDVLYQDVAQLWFSLCATVMCAVYVDALYWIYDYLTWYGSHLLLYKKNPEY